MSLKPGYVLPEVPDGYNQPCVFCYPDDSIELDFVSADLSNFASEKHTLDMITPWLEGYVPSKEEWEGLGFFVFES